MHSTPYVHSTPEMCDDSVASNLARCAATLLYIRSNPVSADTGVSFQDGKKRFYLLGVGGEAETDVKGSLVSWGFGATLFKFNARPKPQPKDKKRFGFITEALTYQQYPPSVL